jgi:hypothetical protein
MTLIHSVAAKQNSMESLIIKLFKEKDVFARTETMKNLIMEERNAAAGPSFEVDHFQSFLLSEEYANVMVQKAKYHDALHLLQFR